MYQVISVDKSQEVLADNNEETTAGIEEKVSYDLFGSTEENDESQEVTPVYNESLINETDETEWADNLVQEDEEVTNIQTNATEGFSWELSGEVEEENSVQAESPAEDVIVRHMLDEESVTETTTLSDEVKKPISAEDLNKRNQERVTRIQEFTAKLKKADGINEFEKEPAFVRRNINLNTSTPSSEDNFSRFGLADDGSGQFSLRNNNFLHDNVD